MSYIFFAIIIIPIKYSLCWYSDTKIEWN